MKLKHCQGCQQLNATIKKAMQSLPAGEHFHVVAIIIEQNKELLAARKREREVFKVLSYHCESYMPNGYCESNCNSVRHFKCTMSKCPLLAGAKARKG